MNVDTFITVDVGNTSTAVGVWRKGRVTRVIHADGDRAAAMAHAEKLVASGIRALAYLSVVPEANPAWSCFARAHALQYIPITYRMFGGTATTLRLDYPKPGTIGADRLADAAGAVSLYGAPVIVCDFGTAFTAAAVTRDCVWRGGVIAPGFPLMRDYLFERTAQLPQMKFGGRCPKIGRSTTEAMRFGALVGYRGMVREIVTQLSTNFKEAFRLVATGGFARWVLKDSGMDFTINPRLTLYGAGLLASRVAKPWA